MVENESQTHQSHPELCVIFRSQVDLVFTDSFLEEHRIRHSDSRFDLMWSSLCDAIDDLGNADTISEIVIASVNLLQNGSDF